MLFFVIPIPRGGCTVMLKFAQWKERPARRLNLYLNQGQVQREGGRVLEILCSFFFISFFNFLFSLLSVLFQFSSLKLLGKLFPIYSLHLKWYNFCCQFERGQLGDPGPLTIGGMIQNKKVELILSFSGPGQCVRRKCGNLYPVTLIGLDLSLLATH